MSSYAEHIKEVFIKPIRSVLAIDDRFPTLLSLIAKNTPDVSEDDSSRLFKLLDFCRQKHPHWLVDVHDGKEIENPQVPVATMKQCNWLILDYKLNGESGDGSRAISILRTLASSSHFNLVAVYTRDDAEIVFRDITISLSSISSQVQQTEPERISVETGLIEWEDNEPQLVESLKRVVSSALCFELLRTGTFLVRNQKNMQILSEFNRLAARGVANYRIDLQALLNYLVLEFASKVAPADSVSLPLRFSSLTSEKKWLAVGNIFVSVESKNMEPDQLLDSLIDALQEWRPSPNQLIIAKLRAELEAAGIIIDREIMSDTNLQAFWLNLLLEADPREENHYVGSLVDRQSELLGDRLRSKLTSFTSRVIADLKTEGKSTDVTKLYLGVDPSAQNYRTLGMIAHNTHVSTKPFSGKNLTSGHVLRFTSGNKDSHWICLSPACDVEPGRQTGRDLKLFLHPWMPLTILKLYPITKNTTALKYATRGWVLFLEIDGNKQQFSYFPETNSEANPIWEEVLAKDEGRLEGNQISLARISWPEDGSDFPSFRPFNAVVVAQLRSEYAASLTLRFTAHLSRIGLDFYGVDDKS